MTMTETNIRARAFDPATLARIADWLAVAVAIALPWSTSATGLCILLWLVAVLPALDVAAVRRELLTAAGALPVLLWVFAVVGMAWADVPWLDRLDGLGGYHRLLCIPLLLAQFRRSDRGLWVIYGLLGSTTGLLVLSWIDALFGLTPSDKNFGVPVHSYIFLSGLFLIGAAALAEAACKLWSAGKTRLSLALGVIALLFVANIGFVDSGRTAFMVAPFFVLMFGWRRGGWKGAAAACAVAALLAGALFAVSPYLRARVADTVNELHAYRDASDVNSTGMHVEFLKKSLVIVRHAPVIGHGTGSMAEEFRRLAAGRTGVAGVVTVNPHNQILAVAIPLGAIGAAVLLAMWVAHLALFRGGGGFAVWVGALIVVDNIVSGLVNTHLFDFNQGWLYVFGVGVAGGVALRERDAAAIRFGATP